MSRQSRSTHIDTYIHRESNKYMFQLNTSLYCHCCRYQFRSCACIVLSIGARRCERIRAAESGQRCKDPHSIYLGRNVAQIMLLLLNSVYESHLRHRLDTKHGEFLNSASRTKVEIQFCLKVKAPSESTHFVHPSL